MNEWISNLGQDSALLSGSVFSQGTHQGLYWWSESNTECWGGLWSLGGTRTAITRLVPWLAAGMIPFSLYCQPSPKWAAWEKTKGQRRRRGGGPHNDPLNCRASVSAAGSGEGGLAPGLCAPPAPRTGPNPTPAATYPSPKAPDPRLRTKRRRNYVTDAPLTPTLNLRPF